MTQLAALVAPCWPGQLGNVRAATIVRGKGVDAAKIYVNVEGLRVLTQAEAFATLQAGRGVKAGRVDDHKVRCEIALPNTSLTNLATALWTSGPLSTLRELSFWRVGPATIRSLAQGAVTMNAAQVATELDAGRDVVPLGVFEP